MIITIIIVAFKLQSSYLKSITICTEISHFFRTMHEKEEKVIKFSNPSARNDKSDLDHLKFEDIADNLKKSSVQIRCGNCFMNILTTVKSNKFCNGRTWAMLCGCIGSCYGIYLILSGKNGFKEFTHFCPSCNTVVGTYKPKPSMKLKLILLLFILIIVALKILGFIYIVLPKLENISE